MPTRLLYAILLALLSRALCAAGNPGTPLLMTFWSNDTIRHAGFPVPGSTDSAGKMQRNPVFRHALDNIDVLAYAFVQVDSSGSVYFGRPEVDLSVRDQRGFCARYPPSCPHLDRAAEGSFQAFARLERSRGKLEKIVSVGGADSQRSFINAIDHPTQFVDSVRTLVSGYRLDGVDLDFEPDYFEGTQGKQLAALVSSLRAALGPAAFVSVEVPADWETLRSIDCTVTSACAHNLSSMARDSYVSLMGYSWHMAVYPGSAYTANDSNLLSDPDEPLSVGFYHVSDVQALDYLTARGVPAERILLGFPAFFSAFGGVSRTGERYGLYQPFDRTKTQAYDLAGLPGMGSYREACRLLQSGFTRRYLRIDGVVSAVFAYDEKSHRWISFEDPVSVTAKAGYVRSQRLGGMMMWQIGEDMPQESGLSLLSAAHRALVSESGHTP